MSDHHVSHLFVYGTLRDRNVNHKAFYLQEHAVHIGRARIRARLYKVTWYPAVILDEHGDDFVHGEVYELPLANREMILHELDGYEGIYAGNTSSEEYERRPTTAVLDSGQEVECWVYNYKKTLPPDHRIECGDYIEFLQIGDGTGDY